MSKNRITINLIIPHYENMFSSFYTLEIIKEVSQAAIREGVDLLISTSWKPHSCSGIMFADMMGNEDNVKKAKRKKIPHLILNYYDPASKENCVGIDNKKAAHEATGFLIRLGHRSIAIITGKLSAQAGADRLKGFKEALMADGIALDKRYLLTGDWSRESGRMAAKKLLSMNKRPTALFATGDEMALGAMDQIRQEGLRIPEDISVIGFDNIPQAQLARVPLTSIEQPFGELASLGVKNLVSIIRHKIKPPVQILLDSTRLIKRASTSSH